MKPMLLTASATTWRVENDIIFYSALVPQKKKKNPNDIQYLIQGRQALTTAVMNNGKDRRAHYSPMPLL